MATTAITAAELLYGVSRLPGGRRKAALADEVAGLLRDEFADRVEPFDVRAAGYYAVLVAERDQLGRPIGTADAQIAAICRAHGATLATRNTKDFTYTGIDLHNPWVDGER